MVWPANLLFDCTVVVVDRLGHLRLSVLNGCEHRFAITHVSHAVWTAAPRVVAISNRDMFPQAPLVP